jgi:uncharacterized membrane protein
VRRHGASLLLTLAVLAAGLAAGFFYSYADSVTRGLGRVDDETYVLTFQAINATVRTGLFMAIFAGPLPLLVLAGLSQLRRDRAVATLLLGAGLIYAGAVIAVTAGGNLPLNDALATTTASDQAARADFEDRWNGLNQVRSIGSAIVFALAVIALVRRGNGADPAPTGVGTGSAIPVGPLSPPAG